MCFCEETIEPLCLWTCGESEGSTLMLAFTSTPLPFPYWPEQQPQDARTLLKSTAGTSAPGLLCTSRTKLIYIHFLNSFN